MWAEAWGCVCAHACICLHAFRHLHNIWQPGPSHKLMSPAHQRVWLCSIFTHLSGWSWARAIRQPEWMDRHKSLCTREWGWGWGWGWGGVDWGGNSSCSRPAFLFHSSWWKVAPFHLWFWVHFMMIWQTFFPLYEVNLVVKSTILHQEVSHFSQVCTKSPLIHHFLFQQCKQSNCKTQLTLGSLQTPVPMGTELSFRLCRWHARPAVPHQTGNAY